MKKATAIIMITLAIGIFGCCLNKPNDAKQLSLIKTSKDTLCLTLIDSEYRIKTYSTEIKEETLYIEVCSIKRFSSTQDIKIPIKPIVKYVKLQNDKIWDVDSIPWKGSNIPLRQY